MSLWDQITDLSLDFARWVGIIDPPTPPKVIEYPITTQKNVPHVHVKYESDGASEDALPVDSSIYATGDQITLPKLEITRDGYTFAGWGRGTYTYQPGDTYTVISLEPDEIAFFARWDKCASEDTLQNDTNTLTKDDLRARLNDLKYASTSGLYCSPNIARKSIKEEKK